MTWAERNLNSQPLEEGPGPSPVTSKLNDYVKTLERVYTGNKIEQNWRVVKEMPDGRHENLSYSVFDIMPQDKLPRNPFNGLSYFLDENDGDIQYGPGQLYLTKFVDTYMVYDEYYFIYLGTDSTGVNDWHAGMMDNSASARNGIFMTKLRRN